MQIVASDGQLLGAGRTTVVGCLFRVGMSNVNTYVFGESSIPYFVGNALKFFNKQNGDLLVQVV